jgi:hypothetical protein
MIEKYLTKKIKDKAKEKRILDAKLSNIKELPQAIIAPVQE